MQEWSDSEPKMWGPTMIGFGNYHYRYASGHEGDAPVLAFSPRKAALTLYVYSDTEKSKKLLTDLGKFKMSKACIYVKKLADINTDNLREICIESIKYISEHHECSCRVKPKFNYEKIYHLKINWTGNIDYDNLGYYFIP